MSSKKPLKLKLSKQQKILLVLFELSEGKKKNIKFEDIVIAAFRKFPKEFHLKGYKKFPDSGDSIKRPLYTLRDEGILGAKNMVFSLTDKGLELSERIFSFASSGEILTSDNLDRYIEREINRIEGLESYKLFEHGNKNKILDTDFFDFLGTSVKTERMDFRSRLKAMDEILAMTKSRQEKRFLLLQKYINFMKSRYMNIIEYKLNQKNEK